MQSILDRFLVPESQIKLNLKLHHNHKKFPTIDHKISVIQNDDKDGGIIILKGIDVESISQTMGSSNNYTYNYTITFRFKDNKYKLSIEDLSCAKAYHDPGFSDVTRLQPGTKFPGIWKANLKESDWYKVQDLLKSDLQAIVDSYDKTIKTPSTSDGF